MKKAVVFALVLVMALSVVGCGLLDHGTPLAPEKYDMIPSVMVDGVLYVTTGYTKTYIEDDLRIEGEITSEVPSTEVPTENDQSNFGTGYSYRHGAEGVLELYQGNSKWSLYATEEAREDMRVDARGERYVMDSTVVWANYTDDPLVSEQALNKDADGKVAGNHLPLYRCDTLEELHTFRSDFDGIFDLASDWDDIPAFDDVTNDFDEDFFAENSLLLVYVDANSGTYRFDVTYISVQDGMLCVNVEQTNRPEVVDCMMAGWLMVVTAEKEVIQDCVSFDALLWLT